MSKLLPNAGVVVVERLYDDVEMPVAASAWAAGLDAKAHIAYRWIVTHNNDGTTTEFQSNNLWLKPGARVAIPLGFKAMLPEGWECQVRPRSGLALKHGITVLNAPGTIDADYVGEWAVILHHTGPDLFCISHGDRIAQLVLQPVHRLTWTEGEVVQRTDRTGGFGSTGV